LPSYDAAVKLTDLTAHLQTGANLEPAQIRAAIESLLGDADSDADKANFLATLAHKGETADEIATFALELRERSINPQVDRATFPDGILADVCGTGADGAQTVNVSTAAMFIVAAAGVPVAKHGNRGITSKCGGADVLEALGVRIELPPEKLKRCIEEIGVGFIFAPAYHPAFKKIAPVRKLLAEKKIRTVFNILGPLVNPARVNAQLLGVFDSSFTEKLARVLRLMGHRRAFVVHGFIGETQRGLDEMSTLGATQISELSADGAIQTYSVDASTLGLKRSTLHDLAGGDAQQNAQILRRILSGEERDAKTELVMLNAAAALIVVGRAKDFPAALALARQQIQNGAAHKKLQQLVALTNATA
jgi:anthranilate phosphoribosyltransferase